MSDNQPDYRQQQELEEFEWLEMQAEIERHLPFKADFEMFVASKEKENVGL